jgi:hypothetical protein
MTILTADDVMVARLEGLKEPVEIHDPSGKVLGHYTPAVSAEKAALHKKVRGLFDLEAARRTLETQRDQGRTLEEIMRDLRVSENRG